MLSRIGLIVLFLLAGLGLTWGAAPPAGAQYSEAYQFIKAVKDDNLLEARQRLFGGSTANARTGEGVPVLLVAADNASLKMTEFLLDNGANVNIEDRKTGETALMRFAEQGNLAGVNLMLEHGADPDETDKKGQTALMKAAKLRRSRTAEALIEAGADLGKTDYTGRTALAYARESRARTIERALTNAGAM